MKKTEKINDETQNKQITLFSIKCPLCGKEAEELTITVGDVFDTEEVEEAKRLGLMCKECNCDTYTMEKERLLNEED